MDFTAAKIVTLLNKEYNYIFKKMQPVLWFSDKIIVRAYLKDEIENKDYGDIFMAEIVKMAKNENILLTNLDKYEVTYKMPAIVKELQMEKREILSATMENDCEGIYNDFVTAYYRLMYIKHLPKTIKFPLNKLQHNSKLLLSKSDSKIYNLQIAKEAIKFKVESDSHYAIIIFTRKYLTAFTVTQKTSSTSLDITNATQKACQIINMFIK